MKPEASVPEAEIITLPSAPVPQDKITALIEMAKQLPQLEQAMDQFRNFVLRRAMKGDWIAFKEMGSDEEVLELTGAATDRIAAALGISFVDFVSEKEASTDDKGPYYIWRYRCTTLWQGRRLECVEGRAGSRDPFFGVVQGELKALSDVKEGDIRTAARRNCMKEGVKLMLGLRRIPKAEAGAMGLDIDKVKKVNFGGGKTGAGGAAPAPAGTAVVLLSFKTDQVKYKDQNRADGKKTFTKWLFTDDKGAIYETIKEKFAQEVITFVEKKTPVLLAYTKGNYGNDLQGAKPAPAAAADAPKKSEPAGDAQEE